MDWIEDLIRCEKAKEGEKKRRMQKRKIKTPQEKSIIHKMHRKEIINISLRNTRNLRFLLNRSAHPPGLRG